MSLRLSLLERYLPARVRRQMFGDLVRMTADAFRVPVPDLDRAPDAALVDRFAAFTRELVERVDGNEPESAAIRGRLHEGARDMGRVVRRRLGIGSRNEAERAIRLVYRALDIDARADLDGGTLVVSRCAFSGAYTPVVCRFISALDAGMIDGLTGGATLAFTERLTEGAACCRAELRMGPAK